MRHWQKLRHHVMHKGFDQYKKNVSDPKLINEAKDLKDPVKYLTNSEREKHKLVIKSGCFYQEKNLLTTINSSLVGNYATAALYAIDLSGTFYAIMKSLNGPRIQHTTLLAGADVICSGYISVNKGKLISISNSSGHYKPSLGALIKALYILRKKGIDLKSFQVHYEPPGSMCLIKFKTALEFLAKVDFPSTKTHSLFVTKYKNENLDGNRSISPPNVGPGTPPESIKSLLK